MISRKSWDYKKTFSKRLRVVKNQTLFIHSRSWTWEHSSDEGHLLQPNLSERPKKNLPLLFFEEEEVEKYTREIRKKEHSLYSVYLSLWWNNTLLRKKNKRSKTRESFAIRGSFWARRYTDAFARTKYCRETKFSLLCFWLFFFVLCQFVMRFFFFESPTKRRTTSTKKEVWIKQKWRLARNTNFSRPPHLSEAASGRPPLLPRPRARLLFLRLCREEKEEEEEERRFPMPNHHHHRAKTPEEASGWKRNRTSQIYSTRQKSRRKRRFGGNSPRRTGFFSPRPRRTRPGRKRRNVYGWS